MYMFDVYMQSPHMHMHTSLGRRRPISIQVRHAEHKNCMACLLPLIPAPPMCCKTAHGLVLSGSNQKNVLSFSSNLPLRGQNDTHYEIIGVDTISTTFSFNSTNTISFSEWQLFFLHSTYRLNMNL